LSNKKKKEEHNVFFYSKPFPNATQNSWIALHDSCGDTSRGITRIEAPEEKFDALHSAPSQTAAGTATRAGYPSTASPAGAHDAAEGGGGTAGTAGNASTASPASAYDTAEGGGGGGTAGNASTASPASTYDTAEG
jgi:hypothetical protein